MEAAIRTVADILDNTSHSEIEYEAVRGVEGIKIASVEAGGKTIRAAVAHGLGNARELLNKVKSGEVEVDFIEIMACPGGCVAGAGTLLPVELAAKVVGRYQTEADVEEIKAAKKVLGAAALTYVASAASSILQLLRIILLTGGRRRND